MFSYNSRHQQTKVETENGNVQENRYDVENLRFELLENGRRTNFVYHHGELLHEEGGNEKQISYHLGAGIDAFQRGQELSYYHRDEQLSTAYITGGNGEIQNSYQYDAFGAEVEANEQFPNRIRYTGQQFDGLTGQYYLRARYYNPVLGRFMQEDSYQGDGLNLYAYCGNNPVVYYDPSGYTGTTTPSNGGCPPQGKIGENDSNGDNETNPKRQTPDQKALLDLANESERSARGGNPISYDEAKILDEWAREYNVPQHHPATPGSGAHFPGGNNMDHTHIYNVHVPYEYR